ncbi:MAG: AcrR family transcriptional regulator [Zhongshania sp.]|jgi:AcrR family transcriptional regulator
MARPYLNKADRKEMLLDTAASIVDNAGWNELSMITLAEKASVSRQLIYQNFKSVGQLTENTADYMFENLYSATLAVLSDNDSDIIKAIQEAQAVLLTLPAGRVQALWNIISNNSSKETQFSKISRRYRRLISNLYTPIIMQSMNLDKEKARQTAWLIMMSFWGAQQLVNDKSIDTEDAKNLITWYVERFSAGCKIQSS